MAELVSRLPILAEQIDDNVGHSLETVATFMLMMIKALAPVDTGALRRSYEKENLTPLWILIGSNPATGNRPDGKPVDYAIHQEFGTHKMAAQPHLRPGFERGRAMIEAEIVNGLRSAI